MKRGSHRYTIKQYEMVLDYYRQGMSAQSSARLAGVGESAAKGWILEAGIARERSEALKMHFGTRTSTEEVLRLTEAATKAFEMDSEQLLGSQLHSFAAARGAIVHAAREQKLTWKSVEDVLPRDRSTLINARLRAEALLETDPDFRARYERMLELLESSGDGMTHEPQISGGGR